MMINIPIPAETEEDCINVLLLLVKI